MYSVEHFVQLNNQVVFPRLANPWASLMNGKFLVIQSQAVEIIFT